MTLYKKKNAITMKKIMRKLVLMIFAGIILFCSSCVRDGDDPCPNYLRIVYDYNMEYVDLFHRQVTFLSIFMFDAQTGVLVREIKEEQHPFPEKFTIDVPKEWFGHQYDIVVWAGLHPDSYEFPTLVPGTSTITDFQLKVKDYENQLVNRNTELESLWHGRLSGIEFTEMEEKTYTVSLVKDTKKFRLVLQTLDEDETLNASDFDIRILSSGGWYNNENTVLDPTDREINFLPYYTATDPETGIVAEMNSLRLMNDGRANMLRITNKHTGESIFDISLIKYLNALRLLQYSNMKLQEYLDREDSYYILIFLKKDGGGTTDGSWLAVQIEINDWIIRFQEIEQ